MSAFGFDIKNSKDFYNKLRDDYSEFMKDTLSSRVAINCAMTAWHLSEWVFHEYYPSDFKDEKEFQTKVKSLCPSLQVMHDIANGTKHYVLKRHKPELSETGVHDGDFDPADFSDDFDVSCLILTKKDGTILYFLDELEIVLEFWDAFFKSDPKTILK